MKKFLKYLAIIIVIIAGASIGTYYYFPGIFINATTSYAKWKGGFETKSVQIGKHRWPYLEAGSRNNETIVFIHGFGASKEPWIPMMNYFTETYHVIAPDLPGFGENKIVNGAEYLVTDQVDRLDRFLAAIDVNKFHLIGVSMGGYISSYYATVHQNKLLSLAIMDSLGVVSPQKSYHQKHLLETNENLLMPKDVESFKKLIKIAFHVPPKMPDHFIEYFLKIKKKKSAAEKRLWLGMNKSMENPLEKRLPMITAKTLIMWGEKDMLLDISSVPVFEKGIANHQTVIFKDIGHVPQREAPKKTSLAYKKFLNSL